ncbi:hypothetical protein [Aestuariivirga sp.]|uniref:hypothetical protein n=1 Tax=Aestuariivirga sp. TaxID=2650926 RepID=UPI0039E61FD0
MTRRNLIIIHRGPDYEADFDLISQKVFALDDDITIYSVPAQINAQLPPEVWQRPTLTVALTSDYKLKIARGPILANRAIDKITQAKRMQQAGIAVPPALPFQYGMKLDPIMFGSHALIKPADLAFTTKGDGIDVFRRERLQELRPSDFPADHPIHKARHGYLVQRFIDTGPHASSVRVAVFLGKIIYSLTYIADDETPPLASCDDAMLASHSFTQKGKRQMIFREFPVEGEVALRIAAVFPEIPLLGIDFVVDHATGKPYCLEVNAGGNSWHFSSQLWAKRRAEFPELAAQMKNQFGAFDVAARALVEKTHALAA